MKLQYIELQDIKHILQMHTLYFGIKIESMNDSSNYAKSVLRNLQSGVTKEYKCGSGQYKDSELVFSLKRTAPYAPNEECDVNVCFHHNMNDSALPEKDITKAKKRETEFNKIVSMYLSYR